MKRYNRWNNIVGWAVFAVAALTYLATMEPSASLWDCSEFIATSYKLEVGHPPGAPLFMMMARLATMLAPSTEYVPLMVNAMNSLASAFCILFMFWTVTHLGRRIYSAQGRELTDANMWTVLGAGAVGALAYTFTDTFWFSAIEGEVYALSSMFTALVVWLMLKWEEQADEPHSSRWIVLIAYLMGLSIGVHILNLLCIPALVFIYYFRKTATVTWRGIALSTLVSGAMIVFVNNIIIPYTVWIGAQIDTLFVNTFGLPVNSGITLFALALIVVGDVITVVMALLRMKRMPNPMKADLRFAAKIVPFGFISMVTTLMLTLNYRVDTLMMGYLYHIPDTEIGFYSLGVSLSEYGWLIPDAFREVLFSRTAKDDAIEEVTMSMKVNFYLTLLMILGILLLGRPVIRILAGAEYLPAYPVTVMLIAGIIPMSYFKIIGTLLLAQGKKGVYLGMLSASVLVNILCNMLTIPLWGKMGAAVASVVSYAVAGFVFLGYYLRTYSIPLSAVFVFSPAEKAKLMSKLGAVKRKLGKKKNL